jgi:hypothetical protein
MPSSWLSEGAMVYKFVEKDVIVQSEVPHRNDKAEEKRVAISRFPKDGAEE